MNNTFTKPMASTTANLVTETAFDFIRQHSENNTIIISFLTEQYLPIAMNWIKAMERLSISNYLLICFDQKSAKTLKANKIPHFHHSDFEIDRKESFLYKLKKVAGLAPKRKANQKEDFYILLRKRTGILLSLLENGLNVLHSDLDAVWVQNPVPDLIQKNQRNYDIISSIVEHERAFPPEMRKRFGFTFCMGFIFWKSSIASMKQLATIYEQLGDDQREFNQLILEQNPELESLGNGHLKLQTDQVKIFGLSSDEVHRGGRLDGVYVCHPNSPKTMEGTREVLKTENLWFL